MLTGSPGTVSAAAPLARTGSAPACPGPHPPAPEHPPAPRPLRHARAPRRPDPGPARPGAEPQQPASGPVPYRSPGCPAGPRGRGLARRCAAPPRPVPWGRHRAGRHPGRRPRRAHRPRDGRPARLSRDGHQFHRPSSTTVHGTSTVRTTNVSIMTPRARPTPTSRIWEPPEPLPPTTANTANVPARTRPAEVTVVPVTAIARAHRLPERHMVRFLPDSGHHQDVVILPERQQEDKQQERQDEGDAAVARRSR